MNGINIAIDGPAGAGKSTIAKRLAQELGFEYLDTGAMYRAITWYLLQAGINIEKEEAVAEALTSLSLEAQGGAIHLNGQEVTPYLRTEAVTKSVSLVSSYRAVREAMVALQRRMAQSTNAILDGRDIGTVVLPQAQVKIFLTASPEERARRRLQDSAVASSAEFSEVLADIRRRDHFDSTRAIAPLRPAEDAIRFDSTPYSVEEVVAKLRPLIEEKLQEKKPL